VITAGTITLNKADAVLPTVSLADIVWLPTVVVLGTVIVAENVPDAVAVILAGVVAIVVVSNFTVTLLLAVNPEPEIVTEVLTPPEVGDSVMVADGDTVKIADPVIVPSDADTV